MFSMPGTGGKRTNATNNVTERDAPTLGLKLKIKRTIINRKIKITIKYTLN